MAKRKKRIRKHVIADMSVHHLSYVVAKAGFTAEMVRADYGYDVTIFTFDSNGEFENGLVFVQLKATEHLRRKASGDVRFRISKKDIDTWASEIYPVYLVVFDVDKQVAYWVYLQNYLQSKSITSSTMTAQSAEVFFPPVEVDVAAVGEWRLQKNLILQNLGDPIHV